MIDSNFKQKRGAMVGSPSYRVNALFSNTTGFKEIKRTLRNNKPQTSNLKPNLKYALHSLEHALLLNQVKVFLH